MYANECRCSRGPEGVKTTSEAALQAILHCQPPLRCIAAFCAILFGRGFPVGCCGGRRMGSASFSLYDIHNSSFLGSSSTSPVTTRRQSFFFPSFTLVLNRPKSSAAIGFGIGDSGRPGSKGPPARACGDGRVHSWFQRLLSLIISAAVLDAGWERWI